MTVAVKVTGCPNTAGFGDALAKVKVGAMLSGPPVAGCWRAVQLPAEPVLLREVGINLGAGTARTADVNSHLHTEAPRQACNPPVSNISRRAIQAATP